MNKTELDFFDLLKKEIESIFLENNSIDFPIEKWKGKDIVVFQEELFDKVKARVSEKWFYTYFKNEATTLPRIDILNFLSEYVGFLDWNDFKFNHKKHKKRGKQKSFFVLSIIFFFVIIGGFYFYSYLSKYNFQFCFVDNIKNEEVNTSLDIIILREYESPIYLKTDSLGCFEFESRNKIIRFVVKSPYYKTDTIVREIQSNTNAVINLQADDYALMLDYYANGNIKDWKKRRKQLEILISDKAQIYQFFPQSITIEVYSKEEFIRKITTPTNSLKNIEILEKPFINGKIVKLKFRIR